MFSPQTQIGFCLLKEAGPGLRAACLCWGHTHPKGGDCRSVPCRQHPQHTGGGADGVSRAWWQLVPTVFSGSSVGTCVTECAAPSQSFQSGAMRCLSVSGRVRRETREEVDTGRERGWGGPGVEMESGKADSRRRPHGLAGTGVPGPAGRSALRLPCQRPRQGGRDILEAGAA